MKIQFINVWTCVFFFFFFFFLRFEITGAHHILLRLKEKASV
ncbi:unnamed protein product [Brassica oleracea]